MSSKDLIEQLRKASGVGQWTRAMLTAADRIEELEASRDAEVAELKAALQAVSDDWDGEHFHNGGSSFMPVVNAALGRGEQEWT